MKTAIVTGANTKYYHHIQDLCRSLKSRRILDNDEVKLCIFNIDFTVEQLEELKQFTDLIITPKWDFNLNFKTQDWKKLLTVRPFLRDYFIGFDNYIWLDADTFILSDDFVNLFSKGLKKKDLNIIPELDISYIDNNTQKSFKNIFKNIYLARGWVYKNNLKYFGKKYAEFFLGKPIFNAGVYSLKNNSSIWDIWKKNFKFIIENSNDDYCLNMDQASLNKAIYENFDQINIFSAKYNWLIKNSLPLIDNDKNFYTKSLPNDKISILHFTQINKTEIYKFYQIENNNYIESTFEKIFKEIL